MRGSVRRAVRIDRTAEDVWAFIGDPARLHEWFPGIVDTKVEGTSRVITTGMGIPMPEEILTNDAIARRFQYKLLLPNLREHVSTLDVHDLGDGTCLATYAADADPSAMALIIAGAAGNALENAKRLLESDRAQRGTAEASASEPGGDGYGAQPRGENGAPR